jgi:hypothetical protein
MSYEIYGLYCPQTGALRYIGAAVSAAERLQRHLSDSKRQFRPVHLWLRELMAAGLVPEVRILDRVTDWDTAEREAISRARSEGHDLLNVADGGAEPHCPLEVRQSNGRVVARLVHRNPYRRRLWELKRAIASAVKEGLLSDDGLDKLATLAERRPDLLPESVLCALRARARARVSRWKCPLCGSPKVQISLPAWHREYGLDDQPGSLEYIATDADADVMWWYCEACEMCEDGLPELNEPEDT